MAYRRVPVPGGQNKVTQGQVHGGVTRKFWELVKFIQLHHIWPHTQSFSTLIRLIERLEVRTQARNWGGKKTLTTFPRFIIIRLVFLQRVF